MPNPWVSVRHDQPVLVNKAVNEKEQLEKGLGRGGEKNVLTCLQWQFTIWRSTLFRRLIGSGYLEVFFQYDFIGKATFDYLQKGIFYRAPSSFSIVFFAQKWHLVLLSSLHTCRYCKFLIQTVVCFSLYLHIVCTWDVMIKK
jgi:hypothetical protein